MLEQTGYDVDRSEHIFKLLNFQVNHHLGVLAATVVVTDARRHINLIIYLSFYTGICYTSCDYLILIES